MVIVVATENVSEDEVAVRVILPEDIQRSRKELSPGEIMYFADRGYKNTGGEVPSIYPSALEAMCANIEEEYKRPTVIVNDAGPVTDATYANPLFFDGQFPDLIVPTDIPTLRAQAYINSKGPGMRFLIAPPHHKVEMYLKKELTHPTGRQQSMRRHPTDLRELLLPTPDLPHTGQIHEVVERAVAAYGNDISRFVYGSTHKL